MGLADRIRKGERIGIPARLLLNALTPVTRAAIAWRLSTPRTRVGARVISFGNLTAGGTGKTPAVIARARQELANGRRVAVLTRGYGSKKTHQPLLVTEALPPNRAVAMIGDEPALIHALLPEVAVVKSAERVAGARAAIDAGYDVLIMDDGFQAVALERDENVLLVDAVNPFGNGKLLPRGILREPPTGAARATHILLTHCDLVSDDALAALEAQFRFLAPGVPQRRTWHAPSRLWRMDTKEERPLSSLNGEKVVAVCGIGHPETFAATLHALGARVVEQRFFADHARIPRDAFKATATIVTTEKDAVRAGSDAAGVWALGIELQDWPPQPLLAGPQTLASLTQAD